MPKYVSGQKPSTGILDEGDYDFQVVSSRLKESKKGSEMIELVMDVGSNGNSVRVFDYLIFDGGAFTSGRIDQFRAATGETILPGEEITYEATDALDKTGRAHVVIEEWMGKKRNKIGSYLEPEDEIPGLEVQKTRPKAKNPLKENSPF